MDYFLDTIQQNCTNKGMKWNEAVDDLAGQASSISFVGAGPFFGSTKSQIKKSINQWIHNKSKAWRQRSPRKKEVKDFLKEQRIEFTRPTYWV